MGQIRMLFYVSIFYFLLYGIVGVNYRVQMLLSLKEVLNFVLAISLFTIRLGCIL